MDDPRIMPRQDFPPTRSNIALTTNTSPDSISVSGQLLKLPQNRKSGIRHPESGIWNLASGICNLESEI